MRWFLADGNQSWLCEATKGRNTRPSFSKLFAEFCSFYFHIQVLIYLSETENIHLFCMSSPHSSRKMSSRNSQIIILLFSFQKVLCKNDIFRYIFARVDVESNQSCQSRRERPIKTSWPEKRGATRNHLWSRLSLSFTRRRAHKLNSFCLKIGQRVSSFLTMYNWPNVLIFVTKLPLSHLIRCYNHCVPGGAIVRGGVILTMLTMLD